MIAAAISDRCSCDAPFYKLMLLVLIWDQGYLIKMISLGDIELGAIQIELTKPILGYSLINNHFF